MTPLHVRDGRTLSILTARGGGLTMDLEGINYSSATTLTSVPVPEPSTMAIAGLGALDMIGYGLRRRKVLGA